jgi:hypothetical protein
MKTVIQFHEKHKIKASSSLRTFKTQEREISPGGAIMIYQS